MMLERCVMLAVKQTRPPAEIIVVDASDDWQLQGKNLEQKIRLETGWNGRFIYTPAQVAGATNQRNQAVRLAMTDVLFVIDDDSLLYPSAADRVMQVYEHDSLRQIVAVAPRLARQPPDQPNSNCGFQSDDFPSRNSTLIWRLNRWVKGDFYPPWQRQPTFPLPGIPLAIIRKVQFEGARMTVRREAMLKAWFDEAISNKFSRR